jgi:hypothetical protein
MKTFSVMIYSNSFKKLVRDNEEYVPLKEGTKFSLPSNICIDSLWARKLSNIVNVVEMTKDKTEYIASKNSICRLSKEEFKDEYVADNNGVLKKEEDIWGINMIVR